MVVTTSAKRTWFSGRNEECEFPVAAHVTKCDEETYGQEFEG
jgi:hypothetical protein